ncbi:terminase small subunit [Dehalococcoidia bacterium]|nr:terminase small subunit [Dehalococcoidia bacterium]
MNQEVSTPRLTWQKLTPRQQQFVIKYDSHPNAADAVRQAGYSPKGAKSQGCRLLKLPAVKAASGTGSTGAESG